MNVNGNTVTVKGNGEKIHNAMWMSNGMIYTIYADHGLNEETVVSIIESIK